MVPPGKQALRALWVVPGLQGPLLCPRYRSPCMSVVARGLEGTLTK